MDDASLSSGYGADARLVRQALAGDRKAFDQLVSQYRPMLLLVAYTRTGDREVAEDLVQEVLSNAWRRLVTLHHPAAFAAWVKTAMLNACKNRHRDTRSQPLSFEEIGDIATSYMRWEPLQAVLQQERRREWRVALYRLPEPNRLAFILHHIGQYREEEIALLLNIPRTTVEGRIHRACRQLRRLLGEAEADLPGPPRYLQQEKG